MNVDSSWAQGLLWGKEKPDKWSDVPVGGGRGGGLVLWDDQIFDTSHPHCTSHCSGSNLPLCQPLIPWGTTSRVQHNEGLAGDIGARNRFVVIGRVFRAARTMSEHFKSCLGTRADTLGTADTLPVVESCRTCKCVTHVEGEEDSEVWQAAAWHDRNNQCTSLPCAPTGETCLWFGRCFEVDQGNVLGFSFGKMILGWKLIFLAWYNQCSLPCAPISAVVYLARPQEKLASTSDYWLWFGRCFEVVYSEAVTTCPGKCP